MVWYDKGYIRGVPSREMGVRVEWRVRSRHPTRIARDEEINYSYIKQPINSRTLHQDMKVPTKRIELQGGLLLSMFHLHYFQHIGFAKAVRELGARAVEALSTVVGQMTRHYCLSNPSVQAHYFRVGGSTMTGALNVSLKDQTIWGR